MERVIVWHRWCAPLDPTSDAVRVAAAMRAAARDRFERAGGEVLFELGGSAAFALESGQLTRAVDLCLAGVREAQRDDPAGGIGYGVTLGPIHRGVNDSAYLGDALDRAQALANAAEPQEVLLDAAARGASGGSFLFARELTLASGARAAAIDRAFPRKSDCQRAVASLLRPPLPTGGAALLDALRRTVQKPGVKRVLLVAPHGFGAGELLATLAAESSPRSWLELRALSTPLAPLSGLMFALRRLAPEAAPERALSPSDERDREALAQLISIREGGAVPRRDAILALRRYLARLGERGRRALVSVDPAPLVDPSSVGVVAEACRDMATDLLVVVRTLLDAKPPAAFARDGFTTLEAPALARDEAEALAGALLPSGATDDDARRAEREEIARRAAAIGGDNRGAVVEALRVMVASGDVVLDDGSFRFRRRPAAPTAPRSLESLTEERIDGLAAPLRRALEILATLPDPADAVLAAEIATAHSLLEETWLRAVDELELLGLVRSAGDRADVGALLRQVLRGISTPERDRELHRQVCAALEHKPLGQGRFARATLAYYLAHAGRVGEAAELFLEVAALAGQLGYLRSGVRLAAAAVECDGSPSVRARAAQIAQRLGAAQEAAQTRVTQSNLQIVRAASAERSRAHAQRPIANEAQERAIEALLARDYDEVERTLELLTAAGHATTSIERLRVLALLAQEDHAGALTALERLRALASDASADATRRLTLTAAVAALARGELEQAVEGGLEALARTREADDTAGQRASLGVLALCYRRLGREDDAARFARAALGS